MPQSFDFRPNLTIAGSFVFFFEKIIRLSIVLSISESNFDFKVSKLSLDLFTNEFLLCFHSGLIFDKFFELFLIP